MRYCCVFGGIGCVFLVYCVFGGWWILMVKRWLSGIREKRLGRELGLRFNKGEFGFWESIFWVFFLNCCCRRWRL